MTARRGEEPVVSEEAEIDRLLEEMKPLVKERGAVGGARSPGESLLLVKGNDGSFAIKPFMGNFNSTAARAEVRVVCKNGTVMAIYRLKNQQVWSRLAAQREGSLPQPDGEAWKAYLEQRFYGRKNL
ncbi:MAG: hypothetical protein QXL94_02000 [Candidatus Parvarchaeum sp.]